MWPLGASQAALLVSYALGMAAGQLLFKQASRGIPALRGAPWPEVAWGLATNPWLVGAVALYAALTLLWVWILSFTPLSLAYPFVALALAVTPLAAHWAFGEALSAGHLAGLGLVLAGLVVMARAG